MSITGVSTASSYAHVGIQSQWLQQMRDYQALTAAIQSGNIASIIRAFAAWQQDIQASKASSTQNQQVQAIGSKTQANGAQQPFGSNSQANNAYQALSKAVQSGNVSAAQSAFASLQNSLPVIGAKSSRNNGSVNGGKSSGTNGSTSQPTQGGVTVPGSTLNLIISSSTSASSPITTTS